MGPTTANDTIGNARLSAGLGSLRLGGAQVAQPGICAGFDELDMRRFANIDENGWELADSNSSY
jgi:hypothetical protein